MARRFLLQGGHLAPLVKALHFLQAVVVLLLLSPGGWPLPRFFWAAAFKFLLASLNCCCGLAWAPPQRLLPGLPGFPLEGCPRTTGKARPAPAGAAAALTDQRLRGVPAVLGLLSPRAAGLPRWPPHCPVCVFGLSPAFALSSFRAVACLAVQAYQGKRYLVAEHQMTRDHS